MGIEAHYGLDRPGIEYWKGRDFPHPSRPVLVPASYTMGALPLSPGEILHHMKVSETARCYGTLREPAMPTALWSLCKAKRFKFVTVLPNQLQICYEGEDKNLYETFGRKLFIKT